MGTFRFLLALSVVCVHLNIHALVGGQIAVQSFFLISGFLISHVLVSNVRYKNLGLFYKSRFYRIYPVYFISLGLALILELIMKFTSREENILDYYSDLGLWPTITLVLVNMFIFGQDIVMFTAVQNHQVIFTSNFREETNPLYQGLVLPQAWSLSLELCFYLLAPLLIRKQKYIFLLLLISLLSRITIFILGLGLTDPWSYRFFPNELLFFIIGICTRLYILPKIPFITKIKYLPVALQLFFTIIFPFSPVPGEISGAAYLVFTILNLPLLFKYNFQNQRMLKIDRYLGELSFPIYITHLIISKFIFVFLQIQPTILSNAIALFLVVLFAISIFKFAIMPIEKRRHKINLS
jgi:peptidoglycan/LPS O-acetylase OafA/YrhL